MNASEMTKEELAGHIEKVLPGNHWLVEAAARLRKPCAKNCKCDSLAETSGEIGVSNGN